MQEKTARGRRARCRLGVLGLGFAANLFLPAAALAAVGGGGHGGRSPAAEHATRWGLLIGLGAVLAVLLIGLLLRARISTLVVGTDHRISTSKTIAAVWTVVVAAALIGLVYANLLNHPQALDATGAAGVIGQYAVLFGGPLGAAILAKQIVTSQVVQNPGIKTAADRPALKDLIANDAGDTDLGDFQYVLFNLVALFYVISTLLHTPLGGLPHLPDVLLGLTSVSAVGYVGKKAVTPLAGAAAADPAPHLASAPARMWRPASDGSFAGASGSSSAPAPTRSPNSLPDPSRPAGTPNQAMPFDHIVVVMMENHSFDNLLGKLPLAGQPLADGLTFDANGEATNSNPNAAGSPIKAFSFPSTAQGQDVHQSWNASHQQVDGGSMDGFLKGAGPDHQPMGFYPPEQLPFAYSLAKTFTLANRWFSSAPCPTYPNRRFLLAGTAYGGITTSLNSLTDGTRPANGTIFDRLSEHGISWRNYFTDIPMTAVIPSILEKYMWSHLSLLDDFFSDCNAGTLPAVSFVDPDIGLLSDLGGMVDKLPLLPTFLDFLGINLRQMGSSQEDPQDMNYGEKWAHRVINAVLRSPAWPRTLLIYTYDEHGGYYDHVDPPPALAPDAIPPNLGPGDVPGGYDVYGPRVPAVVVSPYSRMNSVTDVVHDHTSVLATIEAKWNLPALTYRDANAATVMDFLDINQAPNLSPPNLASPKPAP